MRQVANLKKGDKLPVGGNSAEREADTGRSRDKAGARMGVNGSGVSDAAMVIERGGLNCFRGSQFVRVG
jgi:hypothetical protein